MSEVNEIPQWVSSSINLALPRLGARIIASSDDFFAAAERLISPEEPVFKADVYDENGKWMDGWESRRKRGQGHDHCIIALGRPGKVCGVEVDTRHFTGNFAPAASIEACNATSGSGLQTAEWKELLSPEALKGDTRHFFEVKNTEERWTHVRLNIFPDGGVARLRIFGEPSFDPALLDGAEAIDLAASENGGRAVIASDSHFGELANLIAPGRGINMGDGWETRRRREPGFDWGILKLGRAGRIEKLEIDTAHFKGNFAFKAAVFGGLVGDLPDLALPSLAIYWPVLLPPTELSADTISTFANELADIGPVDHLRIDMIPDGGISRLRAWGHPEKENQKP